MKTKSLFNVVASTLVLAAFTACKKDNSLSAEDGSIVSASEVAAAQAIAVEASSRTAGDSIYVIGTCSRGHRTDSIAATSLPAATTSYLTTNYVGYTFRKAYTDKDQSGNLAGYVVIINYNDNPVGLKFDAAGAFVKVLEQREGRDLSGRGWHPGGRFDGRDGKNRDTVALSALPAAITSYLSLNHAQDTLVRAFKNRSEGYEVVSINGTPYVTVFSANGAFVKRVQLRSHNGRPSSLALTSLPAAVQSYLSTTYPNYVFKHAFEIKSNGTLKGYAVLIDANGTKYAVEFNAAGTFVKAVTIS